MSAFYMCWRLPSGRRIGTGGSQRTTNNGQRPFPFRRTPTHGGRIILFFLTSLVLRENPDAWGTDRNCYLAVNSHSGLVDLFTKLAREDARAHERKPSVLGRLKSRPPEAAAEAVKKAKEPSL